MDKYNELVQHSVTIKGETAILEIKDNVAHVEGYNVESERLAMTLAGGCSTGISCLLIVLDDLAKEGVEILPLIGVFIKSIADWEELGPHPFRSSDWGVLIFRYLAYSPDYNDRWCAASLAPLSKSFLEQILSDPREDLAEAVALREDLSEEHMLRLASHPRIQVRMALAENETLSSQSLDILIKDPKIEVRQNAAANPNLNIDQMLTLAQEEDVMVVSALMSRKDLSEEFMLKIAHEGEEYARENLAFHCRDAQVLSILSKDKDGIVGEMARSNEYYSRSLEASL